MKYKHLLFDADNTLFDFDSAERVAITEIFLKYNINLKFINRYSEINKSFWKMLEKEQISREKLCSERFKVLFDETLTPHTDFDKVSEEYEEYLSMQAILYDGAINVCQKLYEIGYFLHIITNGNKNIQKQRLENSKINKYISKVFISEDIGYQKPSKEFFNYVLNNINAKREECLIIGDSLSSDILGGINSKIDTCWLNTKKEINTNSFSPTYTINNLNGIFGIIGEENNEI